MKRTPVYAAIAAVLFSLSACAPPSEEAQQAQAEAEQQAEELAKAQEELAKAEEEAAKAQAELEAAKKEAAAKAERAAKAQARQSENQAPAPEPPPVCASCGTVASIEEVRVKGEGSGLGAVAGAVLGGVIGHQFGGGKGKDVATGVGAVAGGVAGHHIERNVKASTYYKVGVRMEDGSYRTVNVANASGLAVGTPVRVVGDDIQLR